MPVGASNARPIAQGARLSGVSHGVYRTPQRVQRGHLNRQFIRQAAQINALNPYVTYGPNDYDSCYLYNSITGQYGRNPLCVYDPVTHIYRPNLWSQY